MLRRRRSVSLRVHRVRADVYGTRRGDCFADHALGVRETVQFVVVGISHASGPVELRERLTASGDALNHVLNELGERVAELFVVSTCHRVELYALCGHANSGSELLRQYLASRAGVSSLAIREATYVRSHDAAVHHLLRVASGLESMVVGEQEILGQVRRAVQAARAAGTLGPVLDRLGSTALACGKRVRTATSLGGESLASVAVRLATDEHAEAPRHVVVLGAGATARSVVKLVTALPSVRVTILNRTLARATALATSTGALARDWAELPDAIADADVVFACTGSVLPIIDRSMMAQVRSGAREILLVDLGLPRDVEAGVASVPGVRLIDLEHVGVAATRRQANERPVAQAESIVGAETDRFMAWWRGRAVAATIARLHARADAIRDAELARTFARIPSLDSTARDLVRELATRMIAKLLHTPTRALKEDAEGANMAVVVERLFALGDPASPVSFADPLPAIGDPSIHREASVA